MAVLNNKLTSKTTAAAPIAAISLDPDTYSSGGLLDDVDVVITNAAFMLWDYNGKVAVAVPALGVTMRLVGEESDPDESKDHDQYFSCGKTEDFVPNADGSGLVPVGAKTSLNNTCNGGLFLAGLVNVGLPKTVLASGDIRGIIGMRGHVNRVPAPERTGVEPRADGRKPEILIMTKLIALPGEAATAKPTGAVKAGLSKVATIAKPDAATATASVSASAPQVPSATSVGDASLDAELSEVVLTLVSEAGGTIAKKMIAPKVFALYKGNPNQGAAMKRASSDEFLMGLTESGFAYDGATLSIG